MSQCEEGSHAHMYNLSWRQFGSSGKHGDRNSQWWRLPDLAWSALGGWVAVVEHCRFFFVFFFNEKLLLNSFIHTQQQHNSLTSRKTSLLSESTNYMCHLQYSEVLGESFAWQISVKASSDDSQNLMRAKMFEWVFTGIDAILLNIASCEHVSVSQCFAQGAKSWRQ